MRAHAMYMQNSRRDHPSRMHLELGGVAAIAAAAVAEHRVFFAESSFKHLFVTHHRHRALHASRYTYILLHTIHALCYRHLTLCITKHTVLHACYPHVSYPHDVTHQSSLCSHSTPGIHTLYYTLAYKRDVCDSRDGLVFCIQTNKQTNKQIDKETNINMQADRQRNKQTNKQTNI